MLFVAAAAAVAAAGLMTSPAPGHASPHPLAPGCKGYEFIDGKFVLNQSNGFRVEFPAHADAFANERATAYNNRQQVANTGYVGGSINGDTVKFEIAWNGGPVGYYNGTVRDNLTLSGSTQDQNGNSASWESVTPLICIG